MTKRLYYADSYLHSFQARVVERLDVDGRPALILDQSAFYPNGGGQPADRGTLNQARVIDVIERESDGEVLHILSEPVAADEVRGTLDAARRFDLMQQHSGQHVLSQAFLQLFEAETVSFHLNDDGQTGAATIDVRSADLKPEQIDRAEDLANSIIFENRPVIARFVTKAELKSLPLRKPPTVAESIRIVTIEGFDWSACGGTHVARSGEVGLIKITKLERHGRDTRLEFRCGQRALSDYRRKHAILNKVASELTTGYAELELVVGRIQAENKAVRKQLAEADTRLQQYEAAELLTAIDRQAGRGLITRVWPDHDAAYLKRMAGLLTAQPKTIALLGATGQATALVFARSKDLPHDLAALLKTVAARLNSKGGGSPDFAQAGGPPATPEQIKAAIDWAADQLKSDLH